MSVGGAELAPQSDGEIQFLLTAEVFKEHCSVFFFEDRCQLIVELRICEELSVTEFACDLGVCLHIFTDQREVMVSIAEHRHTCFY